MSVEFLHLCLLQLMVAQALLGLFDTLFHHELSEALPQRYGAAPELRLHALRCALYAVLFLALAWWEWHGWLAWILLLLFALEIVLTLIDFVIEDQTRMLPASERITHTVLAVNAGAFFCLLLMLVWQWSAQATALVAHDAGWLSWFLSLAALGAACSGLRDALASRHLQHKPVPKLDFGTPGQALLTGGSGFVGSHLVRALLAAGWQVSLLSRQPRRTALQFEGRVQVYASLAEVPQAARFDLVVNLAGARILGWHWSARRKAVLRASRVGLSTQLVDWLHSRGQQPRLLLSASAIGWYGIQAREDQRPLHEDAPPQAIFMSELCQEWEAAISRAQSLGIPCARMRFGLVLGDGGAGPMMLLPIQLGLGGPVGDGRQILSWIHIDDVLQAMAFLCRQPGQEAGGAWNFCAPHSLSQHEFARSAAREWHRPCVWPTPAFLLRLLLGEQADLLLEGQRVYPQRLLAKGFSFRYPDLASALAALHRGGRE